MEQFGNRIGWCIRRSKSRRVIAFALLLFVLFNFMSAFFAFINQKWEAPEYVPVAVNPKEFHKFVGFGFQKMAHSKVVFAGLVQNVEEVMTAAIHDVQQLGEYFEDYAALIVENDSTDNSRQLLLEWVEQDKSHNITILGCRKNAKECHTPGFVAHSKDHSFNAKRVTRMRHLREIYLEEVKASYSAYDYLIVWDPDLVGKIYIDGIAHSFGFMSRNAEAESVCAFGRRQYRQTTWFLQYLYQYPYKHVFWRWNYFDTYAHVDYGQPVDDLNQRVKLHWPFQNPSTQMHWDFNWKKGETPFRVASCFGGFAIYSIPALSRTNSTYLDDLQNTRICEHVSLNRHLNQYLNPSMIFNIVDNL